MCPNHVKVSIIFAACVLFCQTASAEECRRRPARCVRKNPRSRPHKPGRNAALQFTLTNPNNAKALELLARLHSMQGRLDEARALYDRVLAIDPASVPAKMGKARIAYSRADRRRTKLFRFDPAKCRDDTGNAARSRVRVLRRR